MALQCCPEKPGSSKSRVAEMLQARNPVLMTVKIRKLVAKAMAQKPALWIKSNLHPLTAKEHAQSFFKQH